MRDPGEMSKKRYELTRVRHVSLPLLDNNRIRRSVRDLKLDVLLHEFSVRRDKRGKRQHHRFGYVYA